jgi:hypothetical protein
MYKYHMHIKYVTWYSHSYAFDLNLQCTDMNSYHSTTIISPRVATTLLQTT